MRNKLEIDLINKTYQFDLSKLVCLTLMYSGSHLSIELTKNNIPKSIE